ncbi:formyltetrahydrofolate deformylase [Acetobacter sp. AN02]|uniref:formyltetrahydrofolate deformylase n=1 Tax=Acetobacter sp. AN02 TaxID=2894186 RepID=UPI0024342DE7|nr:formyltetrahydrofolate deformylase [Acetobacter sp. AN02]MDG6095324.1 formyltetrahydrofolate deformylase [Acetobacter sp. AN02]
MSSALSSLCILTLSCPNRPGIVATVTQCLFESGGDITEAQQFDNSGEDGDEPRRFFMRVVFRLTDLSSGLLPVREAFRSVAAAFDMQWEISDANRREKVLLLVSRFDHCLADLLYRWRIGELPVDPVGIVSNHPRDAYSHLHFDGIPFHYLPVTRDTRAEQEQQIREVFRNSGADLMILARYMQILSDDMARDFSGRCINIHHSFLPGFKGARPYHQAFRRGVKLIGATAHYVTQDLDEGPIIEQDVERISHADSPDDLIRKGRDIERRVLARAVRYHIERRTILYGRKTIVFAS